MTNITYQYRFHHMFTFEYGSDFYVDITFDSYNNTYEAHLFNVYYGVKEFMFGCSADEETLDSFIHLVDINIDTYVKRYKETVGE